MIGKEYSKMLIGKNLELARCPIIHSLVNEVGFDSLYVHLI